MSSKPFPPIKLAAAEQRLCPPPPPTNPATGVLRTRLNKALRDELDLFCQHGSLSEQSVLLSALAEARTKRLPDQGKRETCWIAEAFADFFGFMLATRRRYIPKPDAPEWVTTIPEPNDKEPEVEYQLQAVIGIYSAPCVLSQREYKKLIWTLAKMRGHLQENTGGLYEAH